MSGFPSVCVYVCAPPPPIVIVWVSVCDVIPGKLPCGRISKTHNKKAADTGGAAEAFKMPKRKCTFTDELRKKFPVYWPGWDIWDAECTVCKAGTYVSVSSKGAGDLTAHMDTEKHKKAVRGESSSAKLTEYRRDIISIIILFQRFYIYLFIYLFIYNWGIIKKVQ